MLLWIEGFEGLGTSLAVAPAPTGVVARKYSSVSFESNMRIQTGRLSGRCMSFPGSSIYLSPAALTINATMTVGVACKFSSLAQMVFLSFYDEATLGMNLALTAAGELQILRGVTSIATTSGLGLQINTWYYIELQVLCNSSGAYEVRVAGVNVLSDATENTKAGTHNYHTTFRLSTPTGTPPTPSFDDLYCVDGTGAENNDFLGDMRVDAIFPNGDTASNDWTPSDANVDNYTLVDEPLCDDDTTYVESATVTNKDLYDYESLPAITGGIKGLQINTMCRKTNTNDFTLVTVVKSDANESDDGGQSVASTGYLSKRRIVEQDPNTSAAWLVAAVNVAQFGIKVG